MLLSAALQLIKGLAEELLKALPVLIAALPEIIRSIIDFFVQNISMIIETGIKLLISLIEALSEIITQIVLHYRKLFLRLSMAYSVRSQKLLMQV